MTPQKRIQITPHPRNRVALRRMCQMIWAGEVGLVLVSDMSRVARSVRDLVVFVELCRKSDTLVAVDGTLMDLATPAEDSTPFAEHFRASIQAACAEYENCLRRQRTIQAIRAKARTGHAVQRSTRYVTGKGRICRHPNGRTGIAARRRNRRSGK